ncbi:hypothetical protein BJ742DRAFT_74355 [Cladochytrium replicatum]|nr:hypothetical protein BJ742DRAFT_74355 [Cladochytrium replicatum]
MPEFPATVTQILLETARDAQALVKLAGLTRQTRSLLSSKHVVGLALRLTPATLPHPLCLAFSLPPFLLIQRKYDDTQLDEVGGVKRSRFFCDVVAKLREVDPSMLFLDREYLTEALDKSRAGISAFLAMQLVDETISKSLVWHAGFRSHPAVFTFVLRVASPNERQQLVERATMAAVGGNDLDRIEVIMKQVSSHSLQLPSFIWFQIVEAGNVEMATKLENLIPLTPQTEWLAIKAIKGGSGAMVDYLCNRGIKLEGFDVLHAAVVAKDITIVQGCLNAGTDLDLNQQDGVVMYDALLKDGIDVIEALAAAGGDYGFMDGAVDQWGSLVIDGAYNSMRWLADHGISAPLPELEEKFTAITDPEYLAALEYVRKHDGIYRR